jgi:O-antigen biosynthesis protein WbqP
MKRFFDLILLLIALVFLSIPMLIVAIIVKLTSPGPIVFWSDRVGQYNRIFRMPKFRTMEVNTPNVATHLLVGAGSYLTSVGGFLRKSSLDELPQLWSVFVGDMSFVGPRPALYNQEDLIAMRTERGVEVLVPGITGWAQVNGRDELDLTEKVNLDAQYLQKQSTGFDFYILFLTVLKVFRRESHVWVTNCLCRLLLSDF